MVRDKTFLWVNPEFKRQIKISAIENNMSILEFTEFCAKKQQNLNFGFSEIKKNEKKKQTFYFSI